jgi:hypothetical protein
MHATPQFYIRLARGLIRHRPDLARHYLTLRGRHKTLYSAVRQAHRQTIENSPLADVGFRPPLSVPGCDDRTVVKAEGMALHGVPVAFDLDGRRRHRGTPAARILRRFQTELGRSVTVDELLEMYRHYMAASPRLLGSHPNPKWAKLPRLIERNRQQLEAAELQMLACTHARDKRATCVAAVTASVLWGTSRFMACVDRDALNDALQAATLPSVIVGYCPGGSLRINKKAVTTLWGRGQGSAVLRADDLRSLIRGDDDVKGPVLIECLPETWRGWADVRDQNSPAKTFQYYEDLDSR